MILVSHAQSGQAPGVLHIGVEGDSVRFDRQSGGVGEDVQGAIEVLLESALEGRTPPRRRPRRNQPAFWFQISGCSSPSLPLSVLFGFVVAVVEAEGRLVEEAVSKAISFHPIRSRLPPYSGLARNPMMVCRRTCSKNSVFSMFLRSSICRGASIIARRTFQCWIGGPPSSSAGPPGLSCKDLASRDRKLRARGR